MLISTNYLTVYLHYCVIHSLFSENNVRNPTRRLIGISVPGMVKTMFFFCVLETCNNGTTHGIYSDTTSGGGSDSGSPDCYPTEKGELIDASFA